ncbi:MAG: ribbon-helix-helix protein, CopG family [Chloroflexota bacterium]|nr:ribbon-helix-helix protein, CopG family [Chloroflexota bacterium]
MVTKVTVNLPDESVQALKAIADQRQITMTEALRQAIASEQFLQAEIQKGSTVIVQDADNTQRQIVFK